MPSHDLCALLGITLPVLQAPMAGVQGHALAAAVCGAGALGALPAAMLAPDALLAELQALRAATPRPYNLNFFCHTEPPADSAAQARWRALLAPLAAPLGVQPSAAAGAGRAPFSAALADLIEPLAPPVISFHFGLPEPALLARVRRWGAKVMASATSVEEARWLAERGVDVVIAQGLEAGGHRGHFLTADLDVATQQGLFALLPELVRALPQVPVVAAGGIADATAVAAARALGAAGVQAGTAFLLAPEASTPPLHRAALAGSAAGHTALTNLYTGRPARGIVTRLMQTLGPLNAQAPRFPLAGAADRKSVV